MAAQAIMSPTSVVKMNSESHDIGRASILVESGIFNSLIVHTELYMTNRLETIIRFQNLLQPIIQPPIADDKALPASGQILFMWT